MDIVFQKFVCVHERSATESRWVIFLEKIQNKSLKLSKIKSKWGIDTSQYPKVILTLHN